MDKSLVLFSDVQSYTGDPSKLRLLISGDTMNAEKKYKDSFDLQPQALVVLSSNVLWSPKDSSTGLQRRIIYIEMMTFPERLDRNLFNYNSSTNEVSGTLAKDLPGLINWALDNPDSNLNLLNNAVETNKYTSPNVLNETDPLVDWIRSHLTYRLNSEPVNIGKKTSNSKTHLYANYLEFCKEFGYKRLGFNIFSTVLLQQLQVLISPEIQKERTMKGTVITNIQLHENPVIINNVKPNDVDTHYIKDEFEGYTVN